MSVTKCKRKSTKHADERAKQRTVNPIYTTARRYGLNSHEIFHALGDDSPLGYYVFSKEIRRDKAIRLYDESIYVFSKHSDQCITCYKLPPSYSDECGRLAETYELKRKAEKKRKARK